MNTTTTDPAVEPHPDHAAPRCRDDRAQSTVEYALLLLGVATLALLVVAWATGTDAIGRLFDAVLDDIVARF